MLYLIGLGLDRDGFSYGSYDAVKNSRAVYLENYTVELPYGKEELEELIQKRVKEADRDFVEGFEILKEAAEKNVALLVYGSPLTATTHVSLIVEAEKRKIPVRTIQGASVLDGVSETGLQTYKFGKTASMPGFEADGFAEIIRQNLSMKAHSLVLIDLGIGFGDALDRLEKSSADKGISLKKIVACSRLGTREGRILYGEIGELKNEDVPAPFCLIVPSDLHFMEKEFLERGNRPK